MATKRCYYEVLSLTKSADADSIKVSYRKLAMQYHPDRNVGNAEAEVLFKEAAEAYEILRDPDKRQRYDRYGHAGMDGMAMPDFGNADSVMDLFGDLFGGVFGGAGKGKGRRGPQAGNDFHLGIEIDLIDAMKGVEKKVKIPRDVNCKACSGNGCKPGSTPVRCKRCDGKGVVIQGNGFFRIQQTCSGCGGKGATITNPCTSCRGAGLIQEHEELVLNIPPGVDDGVNIRHTGSGEASRNGGPPGDLYVQIKVKKHSFFLRNGADLHCEVPVTFSQAALGGEIEIPSLDGKKIKFKLPAGIQSGEEAKVTGKGMPSLRGTRMGDLVLHVRLETPKNLTKRQEELFRELSELDHKHISPHRKSFLEKLKGLFGQSESDSSKDNKES